MDFDDFCRHGCLYAMYYVFHDIKICIKKKGTALVNLLWKTPNVFLRDTEARLQSGEAELPRWDLSVATAASRDDLAGGKWKGKWEKP